MSDLNFYQILGGGVSVQLFPISKAVWPQKGFEEKPVAMDWKNLWRFEKTYNAKNNVVSFVYEGQLYALVWVKNIIEILEAQKIRYNPELPVNFSDGDYPKDSSLFWFEKVREFQKDQPTLFMEEFRKYYQRKKIREIPERFLKRCFEIPDKGIEIVTIKRDRVIYYPPRHKATLPIEKSLLGTFDTCNAMVTFFTSEGKQMIAPIHMGATEKLEPIGGKHPLISSAFVGILQELELCGYERRMYWYIPLANGEKLVARKENKEVVFQTVLDLLHKDIIVQVEEVEE